MSAIAAYRTTGRIRRIMSALADRWTPRRNRSTARHHERGQSLAEVMIVVAIIAIIAAIGIPNYLHSKQVAAVGASEANLKQIATGLENYNTDNQSYPAGNGAAVNPTLFGGAGNHYFNNTTNSPGNGGGSYTYSDVAATGTSAETYLLNDPATYETVVNIPQASSAGASTGNQCTVAAPCHHLGYLGTSGIFGY